MTSPHVTDPHVTGPRVTDPHVTDSHVTDAAVLGAPEECGLQFDALVLAGGAARRLGGHRPGDVKPGLVVGGLALVDHALAAVADARRRVLVAPPQLARPGVPTTLEDPPLGGPVAGLAAGLTLLATLGGDPAEVVVVLACDVPRAGEVVAALVAAAARTGVDGARLVDDEGAAQHLVAAYRRAALDAAVVALGAGVRGASVRRLVGGLTLVDVPDPGGVGADADTWPSVRALSAALTRAPRTQAPRTGDAPARPGDGTIEAEHVADHPADDPSDHPADQGRSPS